MKIKVRAIIVEQAKVLLIRRVKNGSEYWVFPGGNVEPTDSDEINALQRECREELGVEVRVGKLALTNTYKDYEQHFYHCKIIGGELGKGNGPEFQPDTDYEGTYHLEWVPLNQISQLALYPGELKSRQTLEGG